MKILPFIFIAFLIFVSQSGAEERSTNSCSVVATPPKKATNFRLERGKNIKIDNRSIKIFAQGNNVICGYGPRVEIFLRGARSSTYSISLLGGGSHSLSGNYSQTIRYSSTGSSAVSLNGGVNLELKLGNRSDSVVLKSPHVNANINSAEGNDTVRVLSSDNGDPANIKNNINTGDGSDFVEIEPNSTNTVYLSTLNRVDDASDKFIGGPGKDTVYVRSKGLNIIRGGDGSDKLYSKEGAYTKIYGDNGNDELFSTASGQNKDELYGGRSNDAIHANRSQLNNLTGAIVDGGPGDDVIYGSDGDDVVFYRAGIKAIHSLGGDDYVLRTSTGRGDIIGGEGKDTISYMLHNYASPTESSTCVDNNMPLRSDRGMDGVQVDLIAKKYFDKALENKNGTKGGWRNATANDPQEEIWNHSRRWLDEGGKCVSRILDSLRGIEDIVGSPNDDLLLTKSGDINSVWGQDKMITQSNNNPVANFENGKAQSKCFKQGQAGSIPCKIPKLNMKAHNIIKRGDAFVAQINGWTIYIGGDSSNWVKLSERKSGGFDFFANPQSDKKIFFLYREGGDNSSDDLKCKNTQGNKRVFCIELRRKVLFDTAGGNDNIRIANSLDSDIFTVIHSGPGDNKVNGGAGIDFITSSFGKTVANGGGDDDHFIIIGGGHFIGGNGSDVFNVRQNPCYAHSIRGGGGGDIVVFVGAGGVLVDFGINYNNSKRTYSRLNELNSLRQGSDLKNGGIAYSLGIESKKGPPRLNNPGQSCPPNTSPLIIKDDVESLEGTSQPDLFIASPTESFYILTRQGPDGAITKNDQADKVTFSCDVPENVTSGDLVYQDGVDKINYNFGDAGAPNTSGSKNNKLIQDLCNNSSGPS